MRDRILETVMLSMLLAGALGCASGAREEPRRNGNESRSTEGERLLYYDRAIVAADLEGRSLRELSLMRNWIFARAGNPFRRAWLHEYFSQQAWYEPLASVDESRLTALDRDNAAVIARYEVSISRNDLLHRMQRLLALPETDAAQRIELDLLYERLGQWESTGDAAPASPLQDPAQLDSLLHIDQMADFSRRDLKLLRNLIYARRQRPFESELMQLHFERYEWYEPDPSYTDARLSDIDRRNIKLLRSLEDEIGGPLSDADEREWFSGA